MGRPPPRIYCIPATEAPLVAVLGRGPTEWSWVGLWDLVRGHYEAGGWLRGRIFPRRSDVSPDGRHLCYFAHKPNAGWKHGETYVAVSRLPWLTALYASGTCGTWTRGYYFGRPEQATADGIALPNGYALQPFPAVQYAVERRRGWVEAPDSPRRPHDDMWDQHRNARMQKRQPRGDRLLCVESLGWAGGEFGVDQEVDGLRVRYWIETGRDVVPLEQAQWADWSGEGNLLVATRSGRLQTWNVDAGGNRLQFEADLAVSELNPRAPPPWAKEW